MKFNKITILISILMAGLFFTMGCSSKAKKTETVTATPQEQRGAVTETITANEPVKTTPADLGANSAGRSR